jgi:putative restriction endonuclease
MTLSECEMLFAGLNVNRKGSLMAPHKPILLLSVLDLIDRGEIREGVVLPSEELERQFAHNWQYFVRSEAAGQYRCNMAYPFFHMGFEPFWRLLPSPSYVERSTYGSLPMLRRCFLGARIDEDLFALLRHSGVRAELRVLLIKTYL